MPSRPPDRKKKLTMELPRTVKIEDKTFFAGTISVDEVTAAAIRKELRRSRVERPYIEETAQIITGDEDKENEETDAAPNGKPSEHL